MARLLVKFGAAPNDKTGDSARTGAQKINSNFLELYSFLSGAETSDGLPTAIPLSRGGTGASTQEGARQALGIGEAASRGVGTGEGDLMVIGTCGFGTDLAPFDLELDKLIAADYKSGELTYYGLTDVSAVTLATRTGSTKGQVGLKGIGKGASIVFRESTEQGFTKWYSQFGESNSIVTVNGNIKVSQNSCRVTWQNCFSQHGDVIDFVRKGVGWYNLTGVVVDKVMWTKEIPLDEEGVPLFRVSVEQFGEMVNILVTKDGEAYEIPEDLWIDLHLKP